MSAIGMIIAMALVAALVMLYMRVSVPKDLAGPGGPTTAIERARDRAAEANRLQQERASQFDAAGD